MGIVSAYLTKMIEQQRNKGLVIWFDPEGAYREFVEANSEIIRYNGSFFPEYPEGTTKETFGHVDGTLPYADFKNMIEQALKFRFGEAGVTRGNKAFDVHANPRQSRSGSPQGLGGGQVFRERSSPISYVAASIGLNVRPCTSRGQRR